MPEGPEIYVISNYLDKYLKNKTLSNFEILEKSRYKKSDLKKLNFVKFINKKLLKVSFKGKKIIFDFGDIYLISFLGLEGKWLVNPVKHLEHKSIKMTFKDETTAYYYDSRHFGCLQYLTKKYVDNNGLPNVGNPWIPSDMYPNIIKEYEFYEMLQNKRLINKKIMDFLLEQKYTAGIGNYIRADALYLSRISPHRYTKDITLEESKLLYKSIIKVIDESLKAKGHSLRTYLNPSGNKGVYEPYVYGLILSKDLQEEVIREKGKDGRTIHWVPSLQV